MKEKGKSSELNRRKPKETSISHLDLHYKVASHVEIYNFVVDLNIPSRSFIYVSPPDFITFLIARHEHGQAESQ